jgi:hypothetical protein
MRTDRVFHVITLDAPSIKTDSSCYQTRQVIRIHSRKYALRFDTQGVDYQTSSSSARRPLVPQTNLDVPDRVQHPSLLLLPIYTGEFSLFVLFIFMF